MFPGSGWLPPPPFSAPHKLLTAAESGCSGGLEVTCAWGTRGVRSMAASSREPRWKPHMAVAGWVCCSSHCGWAAAAQPVTAATPTVTPGTGPAALPKAQQRKTLKWQDFPKLLATKFFFLFPLSICCFVGFFCSTAPTSPHLWGQKPCPQPAKWGLSAMLCWRADLFFSWAF